MILVQNPVERRSGTKLKHEWDFRLSGIILATKTPPLIRDFRAFFIKQIRPRTAVFEASVASVSLNITTTSDYPRTIKYHY